MDLEVKRVTLKRLEDSGQGEALFSLWSTPDSDLDITEKGFFGNGVQEVFMVPHHLWTSGQPPLAKGIIWERPEGAVYEFQMNTELDSARSWLSHFRFDLREGRQPQQQWSYGFRVKEGGSSPRTDSRGRILHAVKATGQPGALVVEVSPVTAASQPQSRTMSAKADGAPLTPRQRADVVRIQRWLEAQLSKRQQDEQLQAKQLRLAYLQRAIAMSHTRGN